jgi:hypothetical protein
MAYGVVVDEHTVRQRAEILLSVADCVNKEGWDDGVAAQLRQAAYDLLEMAPEPDLSLAIRLPDCPASRS